MSILLGAHCTSLSNAHKGKGNRVRAFKLSFFNLLSLQSVKDRSPAHAGTGLAEHRGLGPRRRASYPLVPATCAVYENHRQTRKRKRSTKLYPIKASYVSRSSSSPQGALQKGGVHCCPLDLRLRCGRAAAGTLSGGSPERRCSSRTFRYGYLVTT